MLKANYWKIKSNSGNMTLGTDKLTLDGIDCQCFLKLNESWQLNPL